MNGNVGVVAVLLRDPEESAREGDPHRVWITGHKKIGEQTDMSKD